MTPALEVQDFDKADNAYWSAKYSLGYDDEITKRNAARFTQVWMGEHPSRFFDPEFRTKYQNALYWKKAPFQDLQFFPLEKDASKEAL